MAAIEQAHKWITREDNHHEGYRGEEDDPRAVRWATRWLHRDFLPDWSKWHFTEGNGSFTACGEVIQIFTMDGSPQDGLLQKINCRRCLGVMQRVGFTVPHED